MMNLVPLERPFTADAGHAFRVPLPDAARDCLHNGGLSFLLEDDRALLPGEAMHADIRAKGAGAFSVWDTTVYFSASDNTDCNDNGRRYSLLVVGVPEGQGRDVGGLNSLAKCDGALLALVGRSLGISNSLASNFFQYYNFVRQFLARHGVAQPSSVLELGCGPHPYTGLRFLLEGATRCAVNDVGPVDGTLSRRFASDLRSVAELAWPGHGHRLDHILVDDPETGRVRIDGLEVHSEQPFERVNLDGGFDLVFSVSVLEHVMDPEGVVRKMRQTLRPGGHALHSIDLRDHANFDDPLRFLKLTEAQYAPRKTENRLRASDWFALFEANGFTPVGCQYVGYRSAAERQEVYSDTWDIAPWVTDGVRSAFAPPFDGKTLVDLSTVAVRVLYRAQ